MGVPSCMPIQEFQVDVCQSRAYTPLTITWFLCRVGVCSLALSNELPKVPISWTLFSENLYCHCLGEEGLSYLTTPILSAYLASAELLLPLLKFVIDGAANQTILDSMLSIPTIQAFSTSAFLSHMPTPLHPLALLISSLAITPGSPPPSLPTSWIVMIFGGMRICYGRIKILTDWNYNGHISAYGPSVMVGVHLRHGRAS